MPFHKGLGLFEGLFSIGKRKDPRAPFYDPKLPPQPKTQVETSATRSETKIRENLRVNEFSERNGNGTTLVFSVPSGRTFYLTNISIVRTVHGDDGSGERRTIIQRRNSTNVVIDTLLTAVGKGEVVCSVQEQYNPPLILNANENIAHFEDGAGGVGSVVLSHVIIKGWTEPNLNL